MDLKIATPGRSYLKPETWSKRCAHLCWPVCERIKNRKKKKKYTQFLQHNCMRDYKKMGAGTWQKQAFLSWYLHLFFFFFLHTRHFINFVLFSGGGGCECKSVLFREACGFYFTLRRKKNKKKNSCLSAADCKSSYHWTWNAHLLQRRCQMSRWRVT